MHMLDRVIASVSPRWALRRAEARHALGLVAHYHAAAGGRRTKSWRPSAGDADETARRRDRLAYVSRDMVRNSGLAVRARDVIVNNTVGDGIIPKLTGPSETVQRQGEEILRRHIDTTAIDADGRANLYGLQRLATASVVESGEVLIRRVRRQNSDGLELPLQLQVVEADHIDASWFGRSADGNEIRDGIEYDAMGRRVAYYLYDRHPGSAQGIHAIRNRLKSRRVPADQILHIYRQDRPGQMRGVSWYAPIALNLQDLLDYDDAQLMRQKIAACFAAFRISADGAPSLSGEKDDTPIPSSLSPGSILSLAPDEDVRFADPPGVEGYDEFTRGVIRRVAAGLGITYEALSGDLSRVNFSSARMGRMEMDRNVSSWQWLMLVPQMCQPIGEWLLEAWMARSGNPAVARSRLEWVPPARIVVDPAREIPAMRETVRAGFKSRQQVIREFGFDPETVQSEILQDNETADRDGMVFDTDPRRTSSAGLTQVRQAGSEFPAPDDE